MVLSGVHSPNRANAFKTEELARILLICVELIILFIYFLSFLFYHYDCLVTAVICIMQNKLRSTL